MQNQHRYLIFNFALFILASVSLRPAEAISKAGDSFILNHKPVLRIPGITGKIKIDGNLDDEGWIKAAHAANFSEISPGDQVKPLEPTEVLITYDRVHLYIAFIARDDPASIRATLKARDEIFNDDYVGLILDTYDNAGWAYEIFVNPLGIQGDKRWTLSKEDEGSDVVFDAAGQVIKKGNEDIGFDVVFDSKGRITEDGYQVEISIPFKSLRFPNKEEQKWRVTFIRSHPRDSRRNYSWASVIRDDPCFLCQMGWLTGIRGVRPGRSIELLPTFVGSQSGSLGDFSNPESGFNNGSPDIEPAIGVRYAISSSVGAELAVNPDFSQVESDVAQIDVNTTFALYFPERRPFFQEGSDLFRTWWNVIYTRMINDPSVAVKVTGRTNKTSFVVLAARDEHTPLILPFEEKSLVAEAGRSTCGVFRLRRALRDDSFAGATATGRWYDGGGAGAVMGVDGMWRFKQNYKVKCQALMSLTREPDRPQLTEGFEDASFERDSHTAALDGESFSGRGVYAGFERDARHWQSFLDFRDSSPAFRADNGFIERNNERRLSWINAYAAYPDNNWLDEVKPYNKITRRWNASGLYKAQSIENWVEAQLKRQTTMTLGYDYYTELFGGVYFDDIRLAYYEMKTAFIDAFHCGFWLGLGDRIWRNLNAPALGEGEHIDAWARIKPMTRLVVEPIFMYSTLSLKDTDEEKFNYYILRTRVNYQFNRELFLRLVVQYDDFAGELNVEPLLTYQINPFSVFYIGGGTNYRDYAQAEPDPGGRMYTGFKPTEWHWFFKFQYFFRL